MIKIKFTDSYTVKDSEGKTYEKGKVYDLSEDSANHFLSRNVADVVTVETKQTGTADKPTKKKKRRGKTAD